jgi:predicted dehydrogenase
MNEVSLFPLNGNTTKRPRVGFLGVGWIGRHRMEAMIGTGLIEAAAIADPSEEMEQLARLLAPKAKRCLDLEELLEQDLDGIVIATPSAQHAEQSIRALDNGVAVFCQKPLGRSTEEVAAVVEAARSNDRLLGVDLSYRRTDAMEAIRNLIKAGDIGNVFAVNMTFHNAYGPDKPWFYQRELSGGGCVMDLGIHLVDLALWALDFPEVVDVHARLMTNGASYDWRSGQVEDFAVAVLGLTGGVTLGISCSWNLHAGQDAVIQADFYGTNGGASMMNVDGSFYTLAADLYEKTARELLSRPQSDWGGRAAAAWAARLARDKTYEPSCETLVQVAAVIDRIYAAAS